MAGPLRRRVVVVVLALIGFGVVTGTDTAQAAPAATHAVTTHVGQLARPLVDWWW